MKVTKCCNTAEQQAIKVAVVGVGKLGKAIIEQVKDRSEFELVAVFSRRALPNTVPLDAIEQYKGKVDVMLICIGSSGDAPAIVPHIAKHFSTVDSFDTHDALCSYIEAIRQNNAGYTAVVAAGWDPGLFSVLRIYLAACMPTTAIHTFWGTGVSMGHTNALKQIDGVQNAVQFTVPISSAIASVRRGESINPKHKHKRVCYVVAPPSMHTSIKESIVNMPHYFAGQTTEVYFISGQEFVRRYANKNNHGGQIIAADTFSRAEFKLKLRSNAHFTAAVMLGFAAANYKMQQEGLHGVFTVADIPPRLLTEGDLKFI